MKIGKARYGFDKKNYWKLKDGSATFGIVPPIGDLADKGIWSIYYNIHYGYKNSKGNMRVFQSPLVKNRKTKMTEVPDKALERIEKLKAELEKAKAANNGELVERLMKLVGSQKAIYNMDSHHYLNAIDTQGNIGILKIRHAAKKALDLCIKQLRDNSVDPLDIENGRYFVFSRSGTGRETVYQVGVLENKINVPGVGEVKQEVVLKLTPEIIKRLDKEAAELDKLFPRPTADEVARMVTEGPKAVDEILDTPETTAVALDANAGPDDEETTTTTATGSNSTSTGVTTAPAPVTTAPAPTPAPVVTAPTPAPTPVQTVSAPATPAPSAPAVQTAAPAATAPSPTQPTATTLAGTSDEDFLKTLNV